MSWTSWVRQRQSLEHANVCLGYSRCHTSVDVCLQHVDSFATEEEKVTCRQAHWFFAFSQMLRTSLLFVSALPSSQARLVRRRAHSHHQQEPVYEHTQIETLCREWIPACWGFRPYAQVHVEAFRYLVLSSEDDTWSVPTQEQDASQDIRQICTGYGFLVLEEEQEQLQKLSSSHTEEEEAMPTSVLFRVQCSDSTSTSVRVPTRHLLWSSSIQSISWQKDASVDFKPSSSSLHVLVFRVMETCAFPFFFWKTPLDAWVHILMHTPTRTMGIVLSSPLHSYPLERIQHQTRWFEDRDLMLESYDEALFQLVHTLPAEEWIWKVVPVVVQQRASESHIHVYAYPDETHDTWMHMFGLTHDLWSRVPFYSFRHGWLQQLEDICVFKEHQWTMVQLALVVQHTSSSSSSSSNEKSALRRKRPAPEWPITDVEWKKQKS